MAPFTGLGGNARKNQLTDFLRRKDADDRRGCVLRLKSGNNATDRYSERGVTLMQLRRSFLRSGRHTAI